MPHLRLIGHVGLPLVVAVGLAGCRSSGVHFRSPITTASGEHKYGPDQVSPGAIQSEVMSFTDTFDSAIAQVWNRVAAEGRAASSPGGLASADGEADRANRLRRSALETKIATVSAALTIASSPNPRVSLADMITMITLQRMVLESPESLSLYGPELSKSLISTYREHEEKAWAMAEKAMTPQQQDELKGLIGQWRKDHPKATYVASVRLSDFAAARQQTVVSGARSSGSLLSLVALDPLASLDPAQREVEKSRMLAERMFFYASRSPQVLKWQVESLYQSLLRAPEFDHALASFDKVTESAANLTSIAQKLPQQVAAERSATLDQLFDKLRDERRATLEQVDQDLTAQRKGFLSDLDGAQANLQGSLKDFREAVEATDRAAASLKTTISAADTLAARFGPGPGAPPKEAGPSALVEYQSAIAKTGDAADRLTVLTQHLSQLLSSPAMSAEPVALHATVADMQASSKGVIDHAFVRLLILALVTPLSVAIAAILYRIAQKRVRTRST